MNSVKFLRFWFPLFVYSAIIFYVSSLPNLQAPSFFPFDKAYHFLEYVPFGFLIARALRASWVDVSIASWVMASVLCSFVYGLSDEIHQIFVVGRTFSFGDLVFDTLGGLAGWGMCWLFQLYSLRKSFKN